MRIRLFSKNLYLLCFFLITAFGYAQQGGVGQNYTCETAAPVCPDNNFGVNIPNIVDGPSAQQGPNYGCLISQPRPMWFYMRVATSGNAIFDLTQYSQPDGQGTGLDVDFILWGPFENQNVCNELTEDKIKDCSFSYRPYEVIDFDPSTSDPDGPPNPSPVNEGEYYILLVTNYKENPQTGNGYPGFVNLSPRYPGMTATFDCSILGPTYSFCDLDGDGEQPVDLNNYNEEISGGDPNIIVTYHTTSQNAYNYVDPLTPNQVLNSESLTLYARKQDNITGEVEIVVITFNLIPKPELQEATLSFCDNDGNGSELFNLTLANVIVNSGDEISLTYYTSQADADAKENAIADPTYYEATNGTVVYVRGDAGDCYSTTTITLNLIDTLVLANVSTSKCDNDLNNLETFNLTDLTDQILNGNTGEIKFYENQSDAIAGNNNFIVNVENYETGTTTVYAHVAGAGGCNATAEVQITVLSGVELNTVGNYSFCDIGADSSQQVDLTTVEGDLLNNPTDLNVYYFLNEQDAQNGNLSNAIQNPQEYNLTGNTIIYVYVKNDDDCSNYVAVNYLLLDGVQVENDTLRVCLDGAEGVFNLTTAEVAEDNYDSIVYYPTLSDAQNQQNAINTPETYTTAPTTVYALVTLGQCSDIAQITLAFYDEIVLTAQEVGKCDEDLSGNEVFNLNDYVSSILGNSTGDMFFYENQSDAEAGNANYIQNINAYETSSTVLYVRVVNGICSKITTLTLNVFESPELNTITTPYEFCDDNNDGVQVVDLSAALVDLGATSSSYTITYHVSQVDAENGENAIDNPTSYELTSNTNIYVRVVAGNCSSVGIIPYVLYKQPATTILDEYPICSGYSVNVDAGAGFVSYAWSTGESTQVIEIDQLGNYWVDLTYGNGCTFRKEFTAISGETPVISNVEAGQNSFTITAESGIPPYQYSNGGFIYQDSNVISNLNAGTYNLYVKDSKGCVSNVEVGVLFKWATLFTPNGDGINDYFEIPNIDVYQGSDVRIYDRGGALVYNGKVTSNRVWDGKDMSGNKVPTQDYWYIINLTDGRKFTGHITVKNRTEKGL